MAYMSFILTPHKFKEELHVLDPSSFKEYKCTIQNSRDYMDIFAHYSAVPLQLGDVLELGCRSNSIHNTLLTVQPRTSNSFTVYLSSCENEAQSQCPDAQLQVYFCFFIYLKAAVVNM